MAGKTELKLNSKRTTSNGANTFENYDSIHLGILTNATRLFSAQGYIRASIADLADACKLSRGALYRCLESKEAILFAILDVHIREMIEHVETAVAAGGPTITQFQTSFAP